MIELAFVTCLLAQPQVCAPHSLLFEDRTGLAGCLHRGQAELARWTLTHPGHRVVRYSCRFPGVKETRMSPGPLTGSDWIRAPGTVVAPALVEEQESAIPSENLG